MAPRTPAKSAARKPAVRPTVRKAAAPTPVAAPAPASACGCHGDVSCATSSPCNALACLCRILRSCPLGKHICTRSFWASSMVAFLVIFITDWLVNNHFLMADYIATSAFWRTEGDIRSGLLVITQAVTALAYAAIILGMGHAARWWGATVSGIMAALPVAMVSVNTYAMMPFAETTIPAAWAATALAQGALVGLAVCAALKAARAPETHSCGCNGTCTCAKA